MNDNVSIEYRIERPYVGINATLAPDESRTKLAPLVPELYEFIEDSELVPDGTPFWKYDVVADDSTQLVIGIPVSGQPLSSGRVEMGIIPAGNYATMTHTGAPDGLRDVTENLLEWERTSGHEWDKTDESDGEHWTARLEEYLTDPDATVIDEMETRLAFRLADRPE